MKVLWIGESKTVQSRFLQTLIAGLRLIGVDVCQTPRAASSFPYIVSGRSCIAVTDAFVEHELKQNPKSLTAVTALLGSESFATLVLKKCLARDVNCILQDYLIASITTEALQGKKVAYLPDSPLSEKVLHLALKLNLIHIPKGVSISLIPLCIRDDVKLLLNSALRIAYLLYLVSGYFVVSLWRRRLRLSRPRAQKYKVAMENVWGVDQNFLHKSHGCGTFPHDLFFVDHERIRIEDVLILGLNHDDGRSTPNHFEEYAVLGVKCITPSNLDVPLGYLLKDLGRRLFRAVTYLIVAQRDVIVYPVFGMIMSRVMNYEILLLHFRITLLLDQAEHSTDHIIASAVLERFGGRTVWIPRAFWPHIGPMSGFWGYHYLIDHTDLHRKLVGASWYCNMRSLAPIGIIQKTHNQVMLEGKDTMRRRTLELVQGLKTESKLLAVYPTALLSDSCRGLYDPKSNAKRLTQLLDLLAIIIEGKPRVTILIKPKGSDRSYGYLFTDPIKQRMEKLLASGRVVILHPKCGYFIDLPSLSTMSDAALIMPVNATRFFTSSWVESITLGCIAFLYEPDPLNLFRTDEVIGLHPDLPKLIHFDTEALIEALGRTFEGRVGLIDHEGLRRLFDPYCDDQANVRYRNHLAAILQEMSFPN
ncbi:hypothetical protein MYX04_01240 [Nitrospiraceae bacterium AH_259_D15_M11_P09]|nr:hypothetical protein [Nitrospiraceae bacterium AH_259_D15_M11_P09]